MERYAETKTAHTAISDANPNPVLVCRQSGQLAYCNPAATKMLLELGLDSAMELLPTAHRQLKTACIDTGYPTTAEASIRDRVITWSYHPIAGESAVYLFGIDVTAYKQPVISVFATLPIAVLNKITIGILAVDQSLKVLFINEAAERLLSSNGLSVQDSYLVGYMQSITNKIRQMVVDVVEGSEPHSAVLIPHPAHSPIEILVSAIDGEKQRAAVVFVYDPDVSRSPITDILMSLYGLTPSEAALMELLLGGTSLQTAAMALDVSSETVRTHIKSLFKKTDTHWQAELVRHVQAGPVGMILQPKN